MTNHDTENYIAEALEDLRKSDWLKASTYNIQVKSN